MLEKISEKDISMMELFNDPVALIENLVPEQALSPQTWKETTKCIDIRTYQLPFLSYEYHIVDKPKLSIKDNYRRKIRAGQLYLYCGRKIGKSFIALDRDALVDMILNDNQISSVASFDDGHLKNRMEVICDYAESHPFLKLYHLKGQKRSVSRKPYWIKLNNGHITVGINENITGKDPGRQYHQHHYHKIYYEEHSYETRQGYLKRVDSTAEEGCIERMSGIPVLTKGSPMADIFYDETKRKWLINLPQFINPTWDEKTKQEQIKKYSGEGSVDYKLNILGIPTEGAYGRFDMERIKKCFSDNEEIINFEVSKDNYHSFEKDIVIGKIIAEKIFITADIGDGGSPSEIVIIYKINDKFKYRYNITMNRLSDEEQAKVILYLYRKVGGAFVGIDCQDGTGRAVIRRIQKIIGKDKCTWCWFGKNLPIGFEEDNQGKTIYDKRGKPIEKFENTLEWSNQRLEYLFYNILLDLPIDYKLEKELHGYIKLSSGGRVSYSSSTSDHLLQAFQVFSITQWTNEFKTLTPNRRQLSMGV